MSIPELIPALSQPQGRDTRNWRAKGDPAMNQQAPTVLIVGRSLANSSSLSRELERQGYQVLTAASCVEAHALLSQATFALVLSSLMLPDGSASRLIPWVSGSDTTMYISFLVEHGTRWLPALEHGEVCWGAAALFDRDARHVFRQELEHEFHRGGHH